MVLSGDFGLDGGKWDHYAYLLGLALISIRRARLRTSLPNCKANLILLDGIRSLYRETPSNTSTPRMPMRIFECAGDIAAGRCELSAMTATTSAVRTLVSMRFSRVAKVNGHHVGATGIGQDHRCSAC